MLEGASVGCRLSIADAEGLDILASSACRVDPWRLEIVRIGVGVGVCGRGRGWPSKVFIESTRGFLYTWESGDEEGPSEYIVELDRLPGRDAELERSGVLCMLSRPLSV